MLLTLRYYVSITLLILLLFKAGPSGAQPLLLNRTVTVNVSNMPVSSLLQKLSNETGIRFSYDPDLAASKKRVSINVVDKPLGAVLDQIFNDPEIFCQEIGSQLVIYRKKADQAIRPSETAQADKQIQPRTAEKQPSAPDTLIISRVDTVFIHKTDTVTQLNTVIERDTIRLTDTIYIERNRTQKAGQGIMPNFDRNTLHDQKFRQQNGFYAGITYQQLLGNPVFKSSSSGNSSLESLMKNASSASSANFSAGLIAGYDYHRVGIQSGVLLTRLGELFEHSYTKQVGGYFETDTVETYYTVTGVDTSWYYVTDSNWVSINFKRYSYKNPNAYRYIEIPLFLKFRLFMNDRLECYAIGGVLAGMRIGNKALYILPDEEKSVDWIQKSSLKPLVLSWQAGLGATYNLGNQVGILVEASYRSQITSQLTDYPLEKKFELFNIKTGIFVRL